jgi:hypothetical protein
MRKLLINLLAPALLLGGTTIALSQPPNFNTKLDGKPAPGKDKDKDAPAKSQLELMLEIALKNNPDIRVAEAKAHEADAELNRTRLAVTQKVVLLYNNLESARANVKSIERQLERLHKLGQAVSREDLEQYEAKLVQAKAELAKVEADVPYLLGQQKVTWRKDGDGLHIVIEASPDEKYKDVLDRIEAARLIQGPGAEVRLEVREPNSPMNEKLHLALDKTFDFTPGDGMTPQEVLDFLVDKFQIPITLKDRQAKFAEGDLAVSFKAVSLGAVLQWMEDSLPDSRFVVRDYGLVLMRRDQVPPGALLLRDFWKTKPKPREEK